MDCAWIQRLTIRGRSTDNGIGHYPTMGLAGARATAFERWEIAKAGGDPRVAGGIPADPTSREAAEAVIAMYELGWRGPKSGQVWRSSLETYVHSVIGDLLVAEVTLGLWSSTR